MINNSNKIIGAAIYDTILNLSKDSEYLDKIVDYEYALGLDSYSVADDETDPVLLAIDENPQLTLFFYIGDEVELCDLYASVNDHNGKYSYNHRYIGVWSIVPQPIQKSGLYQVLDVDLMFLAPINEDWSTEARENILFPIFDKIKSYLLKNLEKYPYIKNKANGIDYEEDRGYNFDGLGKNETGDDFSYLRLTFKLQVAINECEREYRVLENKYLILKKLNKYE